MSENNLPVPSPNRKPVLHTKGGHVYADSRDVAAYFDRQHKHVLESIDKLIVHSRLFGHEFFTEHTAANPSISGRDDRFFEMNRSGFALLVMGFTGLKALKWKIDYITAFDMMEAELQKPAQLPYHMRRHLMNVNNVPEGYFSVLSEMAITLISKLELAGYVLPEAMWPDISQGKMFANWLRVHAFDTKDVRYYWHDFEEPGRAAVRAKCYPEKLLPAFRQHLREVWIPQRAMDYFAKRDPAALPILGKVYGLALPKPRKDKE
jgi:Rha family phage regulatory protein